MFPLNTAYAQRDESIAEIAEEALTSLWGTEAAAAAAGTVQEHTSVRSIKQRSHGTRRSSETSTGQESGWDGSLGTDTTYGLVANPSKKTRGDRALLLTSHLRYDQKALSVPAENEHLPAPENPMGVISTTGLFSRGHSSAPCCGHRWDSRGEGSSDRMQDRLQK